MKSHFPLIYLYVFHFKKYHIVTLLQVDKIQFIFLQSTSFSLFISKEQRVRYSFKHLKYLETLLTV